MEKKVAAVFMVIFVLGVQGREIPVPSHHSHSPPSSHHHSPPSSHHHSPSSTMLGCGAKCATKCLGRLFPLPPVMPLCFGLCMVSCKNNPSPAVYSCTHGCANDMLTNSIKHNSHIDENEVSSYVESCYQKCSKND